MERESYHTCKGLKENNCQITIFYDDKNWDTNYTVAFSQTIKNINILDTDEIGVYIQGDLEKSIDNIEYCPFCGKSLLQEVLEDVSKEDD